MVRFTRLRAETALLLGAIRQLCEISHQRLLLLTCRWAAAKIRVLMALASLRALGAFPGDSVPPCPGKPLQHEPSLGSVVSKFLGSVVSKFRAQWSVNFWAQWLLIPGSVVINFRLSGHSFLGSVVTHFWAQWSLGPGLSGC